MISEALMLQRRLSWTTKLRVEGGKNICLLSIHVDMTCYLIIEQYKNEMWKMTYSFHTDWHQIGSTTECDYKREAWRAPSVFKSSCQSDQSLRIWFQRQLEENAASNAIY